MSAKRVMYMEEYDEEAGVPIQDTQVYADCDSQQPSPCPTPTPIKEKPNTSKTRRERVQRTPSPNDSDDAPIHPLVKRDREARLKQREKEKMERMKERERAERAERAAEKAAERAAIAEREREKDMEREARRERRMRDKENHQRERTRERLERMEKLERLDREQRESPSAPRRSGRTRPTLERLVHSKTEPNVPRASLYLEDDGDFYGGAPDVPVPSRPRSRPPTFYSKAAPPPSGNGWWPPNQAPPPPIGYPPPALSSSPSPSPYTPSSYNAHHWPSGPVGFPLTAPVVQNTPNDYFAPPPMPHTAVPPLPIPMPHNNLAHRFQSRHDPINRPASVQGFIPAGATPPSTYNFDVDQLAEGLGRRMSISRKPLPPPVQTDEDRMLMPPPPPQRPQTTRPQMARPPPAPSSHRRSVNFDDDVFDGDGSLYDEASPFAPAYDEYSTSLSSHQYQPPPPNAPPLSGGLPPSRHRRGSVAYPGTGVGLDQPNYIIETTPSKHSRRHSSLGRPFPVPAPDFEDKLRHASAYQEDVSGTTKVPLTTENVRKAGKRSSGNSSRSTRSSTSHDDSEFRQSHTTKTTRSSIIDEDVTIRVTGKAVLKIQGAEIECEDGGEINIRGGGVPLSRYDGSDQESVSGYFLEDIPDIREIRSIRGRERSLSRARLGSMPRPRGLPAPVYDHHHHQQLDYV